MSPRQWTLSSSGPQWRRTLTWLSFRAYWSFSTPCFRRVARVPSFGGFRGGIGFTGGGERLGISLDVGGFVFSGGIRGGFMGGLAFSAVFSAVVV